MDIVSKGYACRLIGLGNYKLSESKDGYRILKFLDNNVKKAMKMKYKFIHWVPEEYSIKTEFIYPDKVYMGYTEKNILNESVDNVIQLERIGYFRIEEISSEYIRLIYGHR